MSISKDIRYIYLAYRLWNLSRVFKLLDACHLCVFFDVPLNCLMLSICSHTVRS